MTLIYESSEFWPVQWIVQFDPVARRLMLKRRIMRMERWTKTLIACSFDDCISIGIVEYQSEDGRPYFGTYFKLKNGFWHSIPVESSKFADSSAVIKQVASATGIPRLDIQYP